MCFIYNGVLDRKFIPKKKLTNIIVICLELCTFVYR